MKPSRVLVATVALTLAGCGWTQSGFDAGHSHSNSLEQSLTVQNVGTLQQHTVAVSNTTIMSYFVVRGWLIVNTPAGAIAYDRTKCPRTDNGPCAPAWTRNGQQFKGSDGTSTMFFTSGPNTFDAVDFSLTKLWSGVPVAAASSDGSAPAFPGGGSAFTIAGSDLVVQLDVYAGHGNGSDTVNVFPIAGCGASSCAPASHYFVTQYPLALSAPPLAVSGDRLVAANGLTATGQILVTGTKVWSADHLTLPLIVHGGDAYAGTVPPGTKFEVFDVAGTNGCGGTPRICAPVRTLNTDALYAASDSVAVGRNHIAAGQDGLALFGTDGTGCSGAPLTCGPLATTTSLGAGVADAALTPHLVFTVGVTNSVSRLFAFDAAMQSGCTGVPRVCSPLLDVPVANQSAGNLEIWDGHVYALAGDGILHVYALPA